MSGKPRMLTCPTHAHFFSCSPAYLHNCAAIPCPPLAPTTKQQRTFKAKPVPSHVYERRHEALSAAHEASRTAAKVKAEMARERVAKAQQEASKGAAHRCAWVELHCGDVGTSLIAGLFLVCGLESVHYFSA